MGSAIKASEAIPIGKQKWTGRPIHTFQGVLIACLPALYIMDQLLQHPLFHLGLNMYLATLVVFFLPAMRGFMRYMSVALIGVGVLIFWGKHVTYSYWLESVSLNLSLVSVFLSVPLLGIAVRAGGYLEALRVVYSQYLKSIPAFFLMTQLMTHLLGVFLNIGSVGIFHYLSQANPYVNSKRIVGTALIRGFASTVTWSPFFAAMALVMGNLKIEWGDIVPYLLGFVVIHFFLSAIIEWKQLSSEGIASRDLIMEGHQEVDQDQLQKSWWHICELLFVLFLIVAMAFWIDFLLPAGLVVSICLMSFLFPPFWLLLRGKLSLYKAEWHTYFHQTIPLLKKEIILFLASGFFSGAVAQTSFGSWFSELLVGLFGEVEIGILLFICISIIFFSSIGFHPIVIITVYVTSIQPESLGFSPAYFAVLLLGTWGIVTAFSPMTAVSHLLSNLLKANVLDVSIRWNLPYTIILVISLTVYLIGLKHFGFI